MRKNSPRKWLHACLDLLPVLIIPLFMIYSSNKNYQSTLSIDVPQYQYVDFNQQIDVNTSTSWDKENTYSISIDNSLVNSYYRVTDVMSFVSNHKYYFNIKSSNAAFRLVAQNLIPYLGVNSVYAGYRAVLTGASEGQIIIYNDSGNNEGVSTIDFNLIDLTQMYGEGNEPSASDFYLEYPNFYDYVVSHKEIVNVGSQTFNDGDVGSQMFYTLYNSVDKYFNMGNVFNMNGVYNWFIVNIFHGNVAPVMYVVWQIVLYEFVMDLLFLLYGLFMWFIDMVQHLMDKPFKSIK